MTLNALPSTISKQRRIMILTIDEDIIDEIETHNDPSLLTKLVLDSKTNNSQSLQPRLIPLRIASKKTYSPDKSSRGTSTCVVCHSPATGYNFGAITCESCKSFFRRNATKDLSTFRCRFQRNCEMNLEMRRYCPACRLSKCFGEGMQRDRILSNEQKLTKRRKLQENRTLALPTSLPTNEQHFQSARSDVHTDSLSPIDTNMILLTDFTEYLSTEVKPVSLSSEELQRIENICLAYQKRVELVTDAILPSTRQASFPQTLNNHAVGILRLLSFFKQVPEFNQLNIDEKVTLVKYNLMSVVGISSVLLYRTDTHQMLETDRDAPIDVRTFELVYGHKICSQLRKSFHCFLRIAQCDAKIIQLLLIVLILTKGYSLPNSSESILNDGFGIYHAQNSFTELLWKYIVATHEFEVAVRLFSELIVHATSWQTLQEDIRDSVLRVLSPQDIDELLPILKTVWNL